MIFTFLLVNKKLFVTTMKWVFTQFSYKVSGFILFCNLLAYTFLKSFFFSSEWLIFVHKM